MRTGTKWLLCGIALGTLVVAGFSCDGDDNRASTSGGDSNSSSSGTSGSNSSSASGSSSGSSGSNSSSASSSSSSSGGPLKCSPDDRVGAAAAICAGVPADPICSSDACTGGVACITTIKVSSDRELWKAAQSAAPGTCVALAPGKYRGVSVPGGVSLLGRSYKDVVVDGVTIDTGAGSVLRGLTIGGSGLKIKGSTGVTVDSVLIKGSASAGVSFSAGASAFIMNSTVQGSARYGLRVEDGADVTVDTTILEDSQGPAVWVACSGSCGSCAAQPKITITNAIVRDNHISGVVLSAASGILKDVDVLRTAPGLEWYPSQGGGGVSATACSTLEATNLRVWDSALYGLLIEASDAKIGSDALPSGDIDIRGNQVGAWVRDVSAAQSVVITNALVEKNRGVGVGTSGDTHGFIFCRSTVANTQSALLDAESNGVGIGSAMIGDGFLWRDGSDVNIDSVFMTGNARASILIDGPATGAISKVTLLNGDQTKGIVIQSVQPQDNKPSVDASSPAPLVYDTEQFVIPTAPKGPPPKL